MTKVRRNTKYDQWAALRCAHQKLILHGSSNQVPLRKRLQSEQTKKQKCWYIIKHFSSIHICYVHSIASKRTVESQYTWLLMSQDWHSATQQITVRFHPSIEKKILLRIKKKVSSKLFQRKSMRVNLIGVWCPFGYLSGCKKQEISATLAYM